MTQNQKIQGKFFPFTQETYQKLKEAKLTAGEWRLWSYLVTLIPFGDRYVDLPCTLDILAECEIGKTTYWIGIAKLQDFGLFEIQDNGFSARNLAYPQIKINQNQANLAESGKPDSESGKPDSESGKPDSESGKPDSDSGKPDSQSLKGFQGLGCDRPQTLQNIQTSQIAEGEGKIFSDPDFNDENGNKPIKLEEIEEIYEKTPEKEIETTKEESEEEEKKISKDGSVKGEFSARPFSPHKNVNDQKEEEKAKNKEKYREKLENLGIDWRRVSQAVSKAHESQILGAIAHVEMNWEEIRDKSAVFLYQLPKQKIEPIGSGRIFRASDLGYSLDDVKALYPQTWREAAPYFGLMLEESEG